MGFLIRMSFLLFICYDSLIFLYNIFFKYFNNFEIGKKILNFGKYFFKVLDDLV